MKPEYIEQCSKASKLTIAKWNLGFNEGDYIWDGKKVRLIGHNFINLGEKYKTSKYPCFRFAMLEDEPNLFVKGKHYPHEITFKYGLYKTESIYNPVWIPTQEQLQNLLLPVGADYLKLLEKFVHFTLYHNNYRRLSKPKEQLWLEYFMWKKYKLVWVMLEHKWEIYLGKLSEE